MGYLDIRKEDGVAVVYLDEPDSEVNKLSGSVLEEFSATLDDLESDDELVGAVLASAKRNSFVVGADIEEFSRLSTAEEAKDLIREGHRLLDRLESLEKPVVAAVHGAAAGGGVELALACHYRLASGHASTKFSLPEVQLGLLPGLGGTQRLPRAIGVQKALEYILTGKNIYPSQARKLALVDATMHREGLLGAAKHAARGLADGSVSPSRRKRSLKNRALEETPLDRLVYDRALKTAEEQSRSNYPAIPKIVECVRAGQQRGMRAGLEAETEAFAELLFTPESKALRHLFFVKSAAEKNPYAEEPGRVGTVGVLGAGLMGAGIAQIEAANAGNRVLLKDSELGLATGGKGGIWEELTGRIGKGLSAFERDQATERVVPVGDYASLADADLVVEAAPEEVELKRAILSEVEAVGGEDTVVATNTSAIPVREVSSQARHPERVLGMHYFSPVPKMPLLEIVKTEQTPEWALATAFEEGLKQGKTVIVVGDGPGFYTTRILAFYINEALLLLEEGAEVEKVDEAMMDFGFPVGPLKLLDEVGIDTGAKINEVMRPLFEERLVAVSDRGDEVVEAGYKGRKSGRGFYLYEEGRNRGVNPEVYGFLGGERRQFNASDIQERLSLVMVNEAVRCLEEGVLSSPDDGDVGAVFGLGFAPFRGGPFWYVDEVGAGEITRRLEALRAAHGERFAPAGLLRERAERALPMSTVRGK